MTHKTDASYKDEVFRKDHYMIIASNRHLASIKAIKTDSTDPLLPGQIMARVQSTGLHQKWSVASGVAHDTVVVLFDELTENEASGESTLRGIYGGEVYEGELIELDATAKTEMGGKSMVDGLGTAILKF